MRYIHYHFLDLLNVFSVPSSAVLAEMLVGNLKMVVSSIFHESTPSFSLTFISFNADFQYKFIAHKIIANYGELTEIRGKKCASKRRATGPSKIANFGKKSVRALCSANSCKES